VSAALRFPLLLSILAAVLTFGIKALAWALTGSVGLMSDALESLINLAAAVVAYLSVPTPPSRSTPRTPTATRRSSSSPAGWRVA